MSVQLGSIMPYAGTAAPTGWMLCDGASLSTTTYAGLFAVIGYTYGGASSNFNLPDLRDRMIVGKGSTFSSLGATGGAASKTLSTAEMPSHTHDITIHANQLTSDSNDPENNYLGGGVGNNYTSTSPDVDMASDAATASNTGSGSSFSIMNPYIVLNYCIAVSFPN